MSIGPSGPWSPPQGGHPGPPVSTSWRIQHSLWLLAPFLGCCLGGLGLVYVGLRAGRTAWWVSGTLYTVVSSVVFFVFSVVDPESDLAVVLTLALFLLWAVTIGHSCLVNAAWLRWRATRENPAGGGAGRRPAAYPPGAPIPAQPTPPGRYPPTLFDRPGTPAGYPSPAPGYPPPAIQGYPGPGYPAPAAPGYPAPAFDPYRAGGPEEDEQIGPASDPWSNPAATSSPPPADPTAAPPAGSSGMTPPPFPPADGAS